MSLLDLKNMPAFPPPPGLISELDHPPNHNTSLIAVNAVFLPLMLIAVAARLYVKGHTIRDLGWDDYTCLIAALGSVAHTVVMMWILHLGFGVHLWDIRAVVLSPSHLQQINALSVIYPITIFFIKLSILLLYLRLFSVNKTLRYLSYFAIAFLLLFYLAFLGVQIGVTVLCSSTKAVAIQLCVNNPIATTIQGTLNVITDIYLLMLPIPTIMKLNMEYRRKIGLLAIFMAGIVACAVSVARAIYTGIRIHDGDSLWNAALTSELTVVEINVAIIAACMSALPTFIKSKIFQPSTYSSMKTRLFTSRSRSKIFGSSFTSKRSKDGEIVADHRVHQVDNSYLELKDHASYAIVTGGISADAGVDNESQSGILHAVNYNVV